MATQRNFFYKKLQTKTLGVGRSGLAHDIAFGKAIQNFFRKTMFFNGYAV